MKKVVLLSGGLDSTTALYQALKEGHEVRSLAVNYGQRHNRELDAAWEISSSVYNQFQNYKNHKQVDAPGLRSVLRGSYLTDDVSPSLVVVPNRNMILLSIGIAHAISMGSDSVVFSCHMDDTRDFPDCGQSFVDAMRKATDIEIETPFIEMTKADIAKKANQHGVPVDLTWTCYAGEREPCGECLSCKSRVVCHE